MLTEYGRYMISQAAGLLQCFLSHTFESSQLLKYASLRAFPFWAYTESCVPLITEMLARDSLSF